MIRTALAGLFVPALMAAIPVRKQNSTHDLLRGAYHSIEDGAAAKFERGRAIAEAIAVGTSLDDVIASLLRHRFMWGRGDGN